MSWLGDKKQALKEYNAAIDDEVIAASALRSAWKAGDSETQQRAQQGFYDAKKEQRKAADKYWGWLAR